MDRELRASIEELLDEYGRQVEGLREMQDSLREISATVRTRDRMVTVVVGPRGHVQDIVLDPHVYERLSPKQLSHAVLQLIGIATEDVAEQMKEIMAPFMPDGLSPEELTTGETDLTALLPQPPRAGDDEGDRQ